MEEIVRKGENRERTAKNKWGNILENGNMVDQERESNRLYLVDTQAVRIGSRFAINDAESLGICSQHISLLRFKLFSPFVYSLNPLPKFYVFFIPPLFSSRAVRVHLTPFQPLVQLRLFTLITSNRCSLDASLET
jgi:hypothetical protein